MTAPSSPELDDIDSNFRDTRIPGLKRGVMAGNVEARCNTGEQQRSGKNRNERMRNESLKEACELGAECPNFVALAGSRCAQTGHEKRLQYGRRSQAAVIAHLGHTGRFIARIRPTLENHIHLAHGFFHFP